MQEAPAIKEGDRSTRNVRADAEDAGDAARVCLFFLGRVVFARTKCFVHIIMMRCDAMRHKRLHAFLVRLPSILLGYSDSSDTTCHVHGSATCVSTQSPFRRRRNVTELRRATRDLFLLFCRVVQEQRVSRHRFAEGNWPCAATNTTRGGNLRTPWNLSRRLLVDCVVFVQIIGGRRSMILRRGGNFCAWGHICSS